MRWFWTIVLAGLLATAGFSPSGMAQAHVHGTDMPLLSAPAEASPDDCPGKEQAGAHHKGCCASVLCGFVGVEASGLWLATLSLGAAYNLSASNAAHGRDVPPETGPPRARA